MHLLLAQKGAIADADEAIDLGQSPADIIFISAADTELASLSAAREALTSLGDAPSLRLANMMALSHPMSIDVYAQNTVAKSRLVVVRVLGGESYWPYGLEVLHATCVENGIPLVALPGDDKPDPSLERFNTADPVLVLSLWEYLVQGGAQNSSNFLRACKNVVSGNQASLAEIAPAAPLLKAGLWWPSNPTPTLEDLRQNWIKDAPVVALTFYRALLQSGNTQPIEKLVTALKLLGINSLPVFVSSLKDELSQATVRNLFSQTAPQVVINMTGFAVASPNGQRIPTVLEEGDAVVLQAILAGGSEEAWQQSDQGLSSRDLAMNVALPEVDGRVLARAIAFKNADNFDDAVQANIVRHVALDDRVTFVAELAANWVKLHRKSESERRVALILANYPNRDGRLGNGVGLDTPAGTIEVLKAMQDQGYSVGDLPVDGDALISHLQAGPTNAARDGREIRETYCLNHYKTLFDSLPTEIQAQVQDRWGAPESDPYFVAGEDCFALPLAPFGDVMVGIQPARGYNINPTDTYHSPDLVPPHGYFAFYFFLREVFGADAIAHMGKHGNMEWLPGKALSLSETCYPEAVFGAMPHLYPFIVNDPGEGTQAKRRSSAVIIDHLTPPLTRAESYGPLKELEALVDEYYEAAGFDQRRLPYLKGQILDLMRDTGLDQDVGIDRGGDGGDDVGDDAALEKLDAYLCELKEMQIRDGLHIFGASPEGRLKTDLTVALARVPRGLGEGEDASLQRALAADLLPETDFDPLDCDMGARWEGEKPQIFSDLLADNWRSIGDTVERLEVLAAGLVSGEIEAEDNWQNTAPVLDGIQRTLLPVIETCGRNEISGFLSGLDGRFVEPGPSGAPTRGRADVLPTGRNFYSVDSRSVPTPAAWHLGQKSAQLLITRHRQEHGEWPRSLGLSAWGTSNMRTGGDDIAQALALIGVRPVWDHGSRRVTGTEIITLAELGRPRVDVTMRISGFFRDAFPAQIDLLDKAIRAVGALEEDAADNPIAARITEDTASLIADGVEHKQARKSAGHRIFGSKPGAYGAGLQALIDEKGWKDAADLAQAYLTWGSYAYGADAQGDEARSQFEQRIGGVQAVVHNQDNREHDLLDSDDYYQFEGGMTAAVEHVSGTRPTVYHNDHSRPERPVVRTLEEEIGRVVRARVVNPKWISGVMRHGYKGAFEIAATVDYMFAFSATTGAVRDHHFDAVYQAFVVDEDVREFMAQKNPHALKEMCDRLLEAMERDLWTARSNSAKFDLEHYAGRPMGAAT